MKLKEEVLEKLHKTFDPQKDQIEFIDERGDGRHFFLKIVSDKFADMTRIDRHRMVNSLMEEFIKSGEVHALRMELR